MKKFILTAVFASLAFSPVAFAQEGGGEKKPAPVEKKDGEQKDKDAKKDDKAPAAAELGKAAPEFALTDVNGKTVKLSDYKGKVVVLEWFNQGCPYCQYIYSEKGPLRELPERLTKQGVVWLSINSGMTADAAEAKKFMEANKMTTPMLLDADGKVGMAYGAKTTPHCYVIDEKGILRYRGALDNAPQGKVKDSETKMNYVEAALTDLKNGKAVTTPETKSYGCNVKYAKS